MDGERAAVPAGPPGPHPRPAWSTVYGSYAIARRVGEVRTASGGAGAGLGAAPGGYAGVVAREEHIGDGKAAEVLGTRVGRCVEEGVGERLLVERGGRDRAGE